MTEFAVEQNWLTEATASDEVEASMCAIKIEVDGKNVTTFLAKSEENCEHLELPVYYLAEWLAENWWSLLWEPRKNEDGTEDDGDFVARHSTLAAQQGFYLPQINFVSNGPSINVSAIARSVQFADVRFPVGASTFVKRDIVEKVFREFISSTVDRIASLGYRNTLLNEYWESIQTTGQEELPYCQLMGALGLSPYASNPKIDATLDSLYEALGESFVRDLCLVARPEELSNTSRIAKLAVATLTAASESDLSAIATIPIPKDDLKTVAWNRGRRGVTALRKKFNIADDDRSGADRIFEEIGFDPNTKASIGDADFQPDGAAIVGAVLRNDSTAKISCIQRHLEQRRFSAARAIFSAWTSGPQGGHLLTQAVTRHQQASRAFAAELLAPLNYIRGWAKGGVISFDAITEIAQNLVVGSDVVYKQALNNGYSVHRI